MAVMTTSDVFLFSCRVCVCVCVCVCVGGGGGGGGKLAVVSVLIDEYKVKLSVLIH